MNERQTGEGQDGLRKLKNSIAEATRQRRIEKRSAMAYLALKPSLENFSSSSNEWEDSPEYYVEIGKSASENNEFIVESDNKATYIKALNFLLQQRGNTLHKIAERLYENRNMDEGHDRGIQIIENYLSGILNPPKHK
jgi:hypothetical protein